jgi:hypothetical protein
MLAKDGSGFSEIFGADLDQDAFFPPAPARIRSYPPSSGESKQGARNAADDRANPNPEQEGRSARL